LRHLALVSCGFEASWIEPLVASTAFRGLETLDVSGNSLAAEAIAKLRAANPKLSVIV